MDKEIDISDMIDDSEVKTELSISKKKDSLFIRILKNNKTFIIVICIVLIIYGICNLAMYLYAHRPIEIDPSHVFVCDNPNHDSDFDDWLQNEINIDFVPTYVIIKGESIIGVFPGDIPESEFSSSLALSISYSIPMYDLPNYEISNIIDERYSLHDIFSNGDTCILEIHWIDCEDCKHQDENYTTEIYNKYGTRGFYRYYIRSEKDKVLDKYDFKELKI